jgi:hypothetical protein
MAAFPDLAEVLLRLLTSPNLNAANLDHRSLPQVDPSWTLLVRATRHLEI